MEVLTHMAHGRVCPIAELAYNLTLLDNIDNLSSTEFKVADVGVRSSTCGVVHNLCWLDFCRFFQSILLVIRYFLVKKSSDLKKY